MALTRVLMDNKFYDDKLLWETYMKWGAAASHMKLREFCVANKMVNPQTGKVSQMGPYWAMWRYAFENQEDAFPLYVKWVQDQMSVVLANNPDIDPNTFFKEKFLQDLKEKAKHREVANEKEYKEFCKRHGFAP